MDPHIQRRAEAKRWLDIAAKLLDERDFNTSRTFAIRAREADPSNAVSDQILAIIDTVLAGEKRLNSNQQLDWYSVLQLPRLVRDPELINEHYRRLALYLNPDRNQFPLADYAYKLVVEAWSTLSDPNKKWVYDNELALYLQQVEGGGVNPVVNPTLSVSPTVSVPSTVSVASMARVTSTVSGSNPNQLNTFQFFQNQPISQPQQQPHPQEVQQMPIWQQQQQINHREFIPLPSQQQLPQQQQQQPQQQQQQPQQQQQQIPRQWQMRDPTSSKGGNKGVINGIGAAMSPTQSTIRPAPFVSPQVVPPRPPSPMRPAPASVATNFGNSGSVINNSNNVAANNDSNVHNNLNCVDGNVDVNVEDEIKEVEAFWTACPYCFYVYEYEKMYLDCTLRCQNCRRAFHAVQIGNLPPIGNKNDCGGGGKEKNNKEKGKAKDKDSNKESSFCCWGFFPLGFSMTAWKKRNQNGNFNGSSNWVPFSPTFDSPVGPNNVPRRSTPRVYIDDDDVLEYSEPSDLDSSDGDWRTYSVEKSKKRKKVRKVSITGRKRGRPRKTDVLNKVKPTVVSGGGVSVGGENVNDGSEAQEVVFGLAARDISNASKSVPAPITRKLTRRSVKDVGRLDLNVEFNNEGEEHAPTVSAVTGEEDGIEFFEGLDEFLSTLPILNVDGNEKAKPS